MECFETAIGARGLHEALLYAGHQLGEYIARELEGNKIGGQIGPVVLATERQGNEKILAQRKVQ